MKFPTMVYRCPGPHSCKGGTFAFLGVDNQSQLDEALDAGWHKTLPEAMGEKMELASEPSVSNELDENEPPSRAELELKANELGIKFRKTTADEELSRKIDEVLNGA